jgi:hypothetical protein
MVSSCKKFIEVEAPYTSFNGENVYTTDATAISAVTALYTKLGYADASVNRPSYYLGLSSDELTLFSGSNSQELVGLYTNDLTAAAAPSLWSQFYPNIYLANAAIESLMKSNSLTPEVNQQLLGEVKFMRAFYYFYLVNLYGDVPLVLTTDYKQNTLMTRTSATVVWQQIISDLKEAKDLLNTNYVGADVISTSATTERVRPNKSTASALLARSYLYNQDWANAEAQANDVIGTVSLYDTVSLSNAFVKNPIINKEAIWQIQSTTTGWNTNDARVFILPATGPSPGSYPFYLNKRLVNSFEAGDNRRSSWIKGIKVGVDSFYYAYKYKSAILNAPVIEYITVFRLAELYLIRAEARAQLGDIAGAKADLNLIRARARLSSTSANTKDELIIAILKERRVELFGEWGLRWFDLKRTNTADLVMSVETPLKGGAWQGIDKFYPIPLNELIANPNLTQTPGY